MIKKIVIILKRKEIRLSLLTLFLRILGVITLFVFTIFFNRNFSSTIVGEYEFTRMFLLVAGGISILGTDVSILYFSGRFKSEDKFYKIKKLYYKIIKLSLIVSLVLGLVFYVFFTKEFINSVLGQGDSYRIISTCLFFLVFNAWTLFNTEFLRALDQIVWSELFRNTIKFFPIFIGAILLYSSNQQALIINFYIKGFVVLSIITSLFVLALLRKIPVPVEQEEVSYREIINLSFPMGVSSIIVYLISTIDIIILRSYYSSSEVAFYALGIKLMTILSMVILSINVNVSPQIAELYLNKDFINLKKLLKRSSWVIFGLSLLVGIFIIMFSNYILQIFGEEYIVTKKSLIILVIGQIIVSSFGSVAVFLNMTGRPKIFRRILFIALFINIGFNFFLIPKYGIIGASISYVFTVLFWNLCSTIYIYKKDKIKTFIH